MSQQRIGRLERPALMGVLVREIINFRALLALEHVQRDRRADGLPAGVRLRLRRARRQRQRPRLRRLRRHGHGRHRGPVLERLPGHVRDVRQVQVPAHLRRDPGRARGHRGAGHRRGAVDRDPGRVVRLRADARGDRASAWTRAGDAARPVHRRSSRASAGPTSASRVAARMNSIDNFSYVISAVLTPLFLVAGTFFPIDGPARVGAGRGAAQPALPPRPARARRGSSGSSLDDLVHLAVLVGFGLLTWRLAVAWLSGRLDRLAARLPAEPALRDAAPTAVQPSSASARQQRHAAAAPRRRGPARRARRPAPAA